MEAHETEAAVDICSRHSGDVIVGDIVDTRTGKIIRPACLSCDDELAFLKELDSRLKHHLMQFRLLCPPGKEVNAAA